MYEAFFQLKRRPFAATPDSQCFLASGAVQATLDEVVVCIEHGQGIAVVAAPAGTGKTLLCERLRSELGKRFEIVFLRHASFLTRRALLQTILCELNHSYRQQDEQELRLELLPAIRALRPQREALVLICDEAHQLTEDLLEELRILSDLAENGRPLVRLVLVGQLGLEETLALSSLEALSQRIRAHTCLETLDHAGSLDYVDYRLTWAGGRTEEIFEPQALELISRAADGNPRCINQLCDHAMLLAYVAEKKPVPLELIREALQDLRQLPLHWNETTLAEPSRRTAASFERELETDEPSTNQHESTQHRILSTESPMMESIEIGADLSTDSQALTESSVKWSHSENEDVAPTIEEVETTVQTSGDDEPAPSMDHEVDCLETIIESPSYRDAETSVSMFVPIAPGPLPTIGQRLSRRFVEELVLDRYAAIDAGMEPPELTPFDTACVTEVHATTVSTWDMPVTISTNSDELLASSEFQNVEMPESTAQEASEICTPPLETGSEEQLDTNSSDSLVNSDFREVCERLDERLPKVVEVASWDSASVHAEIANDNVSIIATQEEATSVEERLGAEVCELADQLQQALNLPARKQSPTEQLHSLLSSIADETSVKIDNIEVTADNTASARDVETSSFESGTVTRGADRPYRNLFSLLRRKQQGLL